MPTLIPNVNVPAIAPSLSTSNASVVWGIGPQYSYENNAFVFDDAMDIVLGNEAVQLSQWITNALITPRLRHYIHGRGFGSDIDVIHTKNYPQAVVKKQIDTYVRQALSVDPRIRRVISVDSAPYLRSVIINVTIATIEGFTQQFQVQWSVP